MISSVDKINRTAFVAATIGCLLLINESQALSNYRNGIDFIILFGLIGFILAIVYLYYLKRRKIILAKKNELNKSIIIGVIISAITLTPSVGSKINRNFGFIKEECKKYKLIQKHEKRNYRIKHYHIEVSNGEEALKLELRKNKWEKLNKSQSLQICKRGGSLGFDFYLLKK